MEYRIIRSKSYKRFLFSYIYVLIVPLVFLSFVYQSSKNVLKQSEVDKNLFTLSYIREIMDKDLEYIDNSIHELSFNVKLNHLMYYDKPSAGSSDMYWFYEYFVNFNKQINVNSTFENSLHIYLKKSEAVISRQQMTFGYKNYYENYVYYQDKDYDTWYRMFIADRNYRDFVTKKGMTLYGAKGDYITILYSIPLLNHNNMGTVACFINTKEIELYLNEISKSDGSKSFIIDANGSLIAGDEDHEIDIEKLDFSDQSASYFIYRTSDNKEKLVVYTKSNFNDWIYISQIPMKVITKNINFISQVTWTLLIFAIFTVFAAVLYFSYRNTKPILSLYDAVVGELDEESPANIDIEFLRGGISTLIIDKKKLQDSLIRQNSALKTIFLDKLLKGYFEDINQLNKQLDYVNVQLTGNYFSVVIVKINPNEKLLSKNIALENDIFRFVIEESLYKYVGSKGIAHILEENEIALIISFVSNENIRENIETILQNLNKDFVAQFNFLPEYGVGSIYDQLEEIHFSLQEARYALNKLDMGIGWFEDLPKESDLYLYSNELELRIVNLVKSGNWKEVNLILNSIYDELFFEDTVATPMQKLILSNMQITIIKLNTELKYYNDLMELIESNNIHNPKLIFKTIKKYFKDICGKQLANTKKRSSVLHEKILGYINDNFDDSDLCVNKIAGQFNISELYFSQFFKEQVNENFSRYLEKIRIDHSIKLLQETDISIDEIAKKSGYNSTNSFRRAFKRVTGVPPSEYSNIYRK